MSSAENDFYNVSMSKPEDVTQSRITSFTTMLGAREWNPRD